MKKRLDVERKELRKTEGINGNEYFKILSKESEEIEKCYKPETKGLIQKYYPVWLKNREMLNPDI